MSERVSERPEGFVPLSCAVLTVSDTRSLQTDSSGAEIARALTAAGHQLADRALVEDEQTAISAQVASWVDAEAIQVVITTGGTGITRRDVTVEALRPLITKELPGFGELFRWLSYEQIGASTIQSRALAGICKTTLLFVLPGSTGAVRLALERIILPQLDARTRPCNFAQLLPRL
jgi:molybdenum cofactor biosynthesis protein B